jgi:hypothetical protein
MKTGRGRWWFIRIVPLMIPVLFFGCGGVGASEDEQQPIQLKDLYPQQGETEVPLDVAVIAAFNDNVFTQGNCSDTTYISGTNFSLAPSGGGTAVTATVSCSRANNGSGLEDVLTTARLEPAANLEANTEYCITIDETVSGETKDPLGVAIVSCFTTVNQ